LINRERHAIVRLHRLIDPPFQDNVDELTPPRNVGRSF